MNNYCNKCPLKNCANCREYLKFDADSDEAKQIIANHFNVNKYIESLQEAE